MIINGDLLNAKEDIIVHQVNTIGVMGAGIALQIKKKYPIVYQKYTKLIGQTDVREDLMGCCQIISVGNRGKDNIKYVANIYGQLDIGRNKQQTDYNALSKSLEELFSFAKKNQLTVALPYNIGCGLAGGDWNVVSRLISEAADDYPYTLYRYIAHKSHR